MEPMGRASGLKASNVGGCCASANPGILVRKSSTTTCGVHRGRGLPPPVLTEEKLDLLLKDNGTYSITRIMNK